MAAPTIRSSTTFTNASGSSVNATKPAGAVVGDLLIFHAWSDNGDPAPTISAATLIGRTLLANDGTCGSTFVFYRVIDGTEGATFTVSGSTQGGGVLTLIEAGTYDSGFATSLVFGISNTTTNVTSHVCGSITTAVADCLLLASTASHSNDAVSAVPAGMTLVGQSSTAANGVGGVAWQALGSAGATGTRTFTLAGADQGSETMLAIPPASGATGTAATAVAAAVSAAGGVAASGSAAGAVTAATVATGAVAASGAASAPVVAATSAAGTVFALTPTAAVTVTAAPSATGRVGRLGSAARAVAVATTATGSRGVAGSAARSVVAATTAAGVVQLPPGSATTAVAAAVTAVGAVSAVGGTALAVAAATTAAGVVRVPRDITLLASLPDRSKVGVLADRPNRVVVLADRPDAGLLTTHPLLVAVTGARRAAARLDDQKERP